MKPTEDEFGLRLAAEAADREKAFAECGPAVRAQLEQRLLQWGSAKLTKCCLVVGNVDEALEARHTKEPERIHTTLTHEQRREHKLHRSAAQHGLCLKKSIPGDDRARHGTSGRYAQGT